MGAKPGRAVFSIWRVLVKHDKRQHLMSAAEFKTSHPEAEGVSVLKFSGESSLVKEPTDDDDRIVSFVISTDSVDRDNDTIALDGWELDAFLKNPAVLWAHSRTDPPIGRAVSVESGDGRLTAQVEFATTPQAEEIYQLVRGGFINATSVGFRPIDWELNDEREGIDFLRQELTEFSVVPVPANAEALISASASGADLEVLRSWVQDVIEAWPGELKLKGKVWDKLQGEEEEDVAIVTPDGSTRTINEEGDILVTPAKKGEDHCPTCGSGLTPEESGEPGEVTIDGLAEVGDLLAEADEILSRLEALNNGEGEEEREDDGDDEFVLMIEDDEEREEDLIEIDPDALRAVLVETAPGLVSKAIREQVDESLSYLSGRV
jgi:HK97 family phage prohead protease